MRLIQCVLVGGLVLLAFSARAKGLPFDSCFESASQRYKVDKKVLAAIAKTESSFNPNIVGPINKNGSYDMGVMQINSTWLPKLQKHGISKGDLMAVCTNINVGAWILAMNIQRHGESWRAVGAYNASTASKQVNYVAKVQRNYTLVSKLDV